MGISSANGVLKASGIISKTAPTLIGSVDCDGYDWLTLLLNYTKGDETGLDIYPWLLRAAGGNEYQQTVWTITAGVGASVASKYRLLATLKTYITFDVRGVALMKFYQGGSNNDGTPTGTLATDYILDT